MYNSTIYEKGRRQKAIESSLDEAYSGCISTDEGHEAMEKETCDTA
jgi:hypothetical protein